MGLETGIGEPAGAGAGAAAAAAATGIGKMGPVEMKGHWRQMLKLSDSLARVWGKMVQRGEEQERGIHHHGCKQ